MGGILILRKCDVEGVTDARFVTAGSCAIRGNAEPCNVTHVKTQESTDAGVRLVADAQHPRASERNSGSAIPSPAATRIGMYSGRQPAMTPLTATLHTLASLRSGSRTPSTSSADLGAKGRN